MTQASDHVIYYSRPAAEWNEALPIGNGRLGGMVWGGGRIERISLNEETIWGGGPYVPVQQSTYYQLAKIREHVFKDEFAKADALATESFMGRPSHMASYQPMGELILEMAEIDGFILQNYRRQLDLDTSIASTSFDARGHNYRRHVFVHPERQVMVLHLEADAPGKISFNLTAGSPHQSMLSTAIESSTLRLNGRGTPENGLSGAIRFQALFKVKTLNGSVDRSDDHLRVRNADSATIYLAIATNFKSYNDLTIDYESLVQQRIDDASTIAYADLARETATTHQTLYRRVQLVLDTSDDSTRPTPERLEAFRQGGQDPSLCALYFNFGRYLLIASSRSCTQPANLQGIWNDVLRPSWGSHFTLNINSEMNYWPTEAANLPELLDPLISLVRDLAVTGAVTAKTMYGARGWVCHHNTDIWRASAPIELPIYGQWPLSGAWLCKHLWDRYEYGCDLEYLQSVYPLFRDASLFFLDFLVIDPKSGYLVTNPSMSPENIHPHGVAICAGPTMDAQILSDLFTWTVTAAELLDLDPDLRQQCRQARSSLPPTEVGQHGQVKEWQEEWDALVPDPHHRHTSHLYGLYPSDQINFRDRPDLTKAAEKTLVDRGAAQTGWATAWRLNLYARLLDGRGAYKMLEHLLSHEMCYDNMFDAHPALDKGAVSVFQIDGNLGGSAGIMEMIVQSYRESIILLPALPDAWPSGRLVGVRVRGGWSLDIYWDHGRLINVVITSVLRAGKQTLHYDGDEAVIQLKKGQCINFTVGEFR
jgi:alpha-L-fucosidase 2